MRPVDWQWERAKSLVADRRHYHPDHDDAVTELAMKFLGSTDKVTEKRTRGSIRAWYREFERKSK